MKPNYLVIGAAKCATSSLCKLIGDHPDAFMCNPKEPFFFSHDRNYVDRGWEWYQSLFAEAEGCAAVGEGSVTYTISGIWPDACERIASDLPDARLIYIVRNPIQQIESHWIMLRSFWTEFLEDGVNAPADFNRAVCEEPIFMDSARYLRQIERYRKHFPDDRILVLFYEDFRKDPDAVLTRCFAFLGLDSTIRIENAHEPTNVSKHHRFDRWWFKPVRLIPGASAMRHLIPDRLRYVLRPVLRSRVKERPNWDDETMRWAVSELAEETREFLVRYGKPEDFWALDESDAEPSPTP